MKRGTLRETEFNFIFLFWCWLTIFSVRFHITFDFKIPTPNSFSHPKSTWWRALLHLHRIVEGLYFHCSLSVSVCLSVCFWTKFHLKRCTDNDMIFAKRLMFTALACHLLKLVTLGPTPNVKVSVTQYQFFSSKFSVNLPTIDLNSLMSDPIEIWYAV